MEQAYAVISISPVAYLYSLSSIVLPFTANISLMEVKSPKHIGNIIAAVAVLLTQPEQSAAARPIAKKMRLGLDPTQDLDKIQYANRLSSPLVIIAFAKIKPPKNKKIIGLANAKNASPTFTTPVATARVGPIKLVIGMGTGSVIHHSATSTVIASSLCASKEIASIGVKNTKRARTGAPKSPTVRRFLSKASSASLTFFASKLALFIICPSSLTLTLMNISHSYVSRVHIRENNGVKSEFAVFYAYKVA